MVEHRIFLAGRRVSQDGMCLRSTAPGPVGLPRRLAGIGGPSSPACPVWVPGTQVTSDTQLTLQQNSSPGPPPRRPDVTSQACPVLHLLVDLGPSDFAVKKMVTPSLVSDEETEAQLQRDFRPS